jgi:hypothetical protein
MLHGLSGARYVATTHVPRGAQRDIDDPIVRAAPEISLDLAGKPVKKPDEAAWVGGLAGTR